MLNGIYAAFIAAILLVLVVYYAQKQIGDVLVIKELLYPRCVAGYCFYHRNFSECDIYFCLSDPLFAYEN